MYNESLREMALLTLRKTHCYLQIPNLRVMRSQSWSQTLLRATMLKDRSQKAQAGIPTWYKKRKSNIRVKDWEHADLRVCRVSILPNAKSWTEPSHNQLPLTGWLWAAPDLWRAFSAYKVLWVCVLWAQRTKMYMHNYAGCSGHIWEFCNFAF